MTMTMISHRMVESATHVSREAELRANEHILAGLVQRLRSAETIDDCLCTLADSRMYAGFRLVGFRDGHMPAVARMRHAQRWSRRFGWPSGFLREWLRLNLAAVNLPSETLPTATRRILHWSLPGVEALRLDNNSDETERARVRFLRSYGIESGIIVTDTRLHGETGQVSWFKFHEGRKPGNVLSDPGLTLLASMFFESMDRLRPTDTSLLLSKRELECLTWAAYGLTDKEIATELSCSYDTIRFHMKNTLRNLAAANRTHAVAIAIQAGLVTLGGSTSTARRHTLHSIHAQDEEARLKRARTP
jgi:DNA-binding CsgD family transcriptional regulator